MQVAIIIPSRMASQRLPEKPLADIHGKPMIVRVYEQAKKSKLASQVIVATDDQKILSVIEKAGGKAVMTPSELPSGTDRVAFVAKSLKEEVIVNLQGDEPMMDPQGLDRAIELVTSGLFTMSTLACPLKQAEDLKNPNVVKVLVGHAKQALYFSRYPIPYSRIDPPSRDFICQKHIGLYVYTQKTLTFLSAQKPEPLEKAESLEQLRALMHGIAIGVAMTDKEPLSVDTPEDLELVRKRFSV